MSKYSDNFNFRFPNVFHCLLVIFCIFGFHTRRCLIIETVGNLKIADTLCKPVNCALTFCVIMGSVPTVGGGGGVKDK